MKAGSASRLAPWFYRTAACRATRRRGPGRRSCPGKAAQKKLNRLLAYYRVGVEHAISGVKRCRIAFDTFRNLRAGLVDTAMEVAAGLHNLRITTRGCTLA